MKILELFRELELKADSAGNDMGYFVFIKEFQIYRGVLVTKIKIILYLVYFWKEFLSVVFVVFHSLGLDLVVLKAHGDLKARLGRHAAVDTL